MSDIHDTHDRIAEQIRIHTDHEAAWAFVSEPGWFINDGALTSHQLLWEDERVEVLDPQHGRFTFDRIAHDPPNSIVLRSVDAGAASGRTVELRVTADAGDCTVFVVETGFATMPVPRSEQVAHHQQNTRTWRHQLQLAKAHLERQ